MNVRVDEEKKLVFVSPAGILDISTSSQLEKKLNSEHESHPGFNFIINMEKVESVSSTCMRVFVTFNQKLKDAGSTMCIANTSPVPPVGVLSRKDEYPDPEELKQAIRSLCRAVWFVDGTGMALKLGATIATNIVMVGALIGSEQVPLTKKEIEDQMRETFPSNRMALNLQALEMGFEAIRSQN